MRSRGTRAATGRSTSATSVAAAVRPGRVPPTREAVRRSSSHSLCPGCPEPACAMRMRAGRMASGRIRAFCRYQGEPICRPIHWGPPTRTRRNSTSSHMTSQGRCSRRTRADHAAAKVSRPTTIPMGTVAPGAVPYIGRSMSACPRVATALAAPPAGRWYPRTEVRELRMSQAPAPRNSTAAKTPVARRARAPRLPALRRHREAAASTRKGRVRIARLNRPVPCAATTPQAAARARRTSVR